MTSRAALAIYQAMILPLLTYCSTVTCSYNSSFMKKLLTIEHRAARVIFNDALKLTSIEEEIKKRICIQVYDCINDNTCHSFSNYFEIMKNNTRNKGKLIRLPNGKLEVFKKSFRFYGAKSFNNLSFQCRSAKTRAEFLRFFTIFK
jgi:hypothetical protein